jgi:hypothetical protein
VVGFRNRRLSGVLILTVSPAGDRIDKVHVIADPAKLAFFSGSLDAASAAGSTQT